MSENKIRLQPEERKNQSELNDEQIDEANGGMHVSCTWASRYGFEETLKKWEESQHPHGRQK